MKPALFSLFICVLLFSFGTLQSQSSVQMSEIEVDISQGDKIMAIHTIRKGETLYSIARFYKVPLRDLMSTNNILPEQIISLNSEIKIPINNNLINKSGHKIDDSWIPVVYTVKKKETLYTIGKKYFDQNIEDLNKRNNINSFIIHENEKLIIGWWSIPEQLTEAEDVVIKEIPQKEKIVNPKEDPITTVDSAKIYAVKQKAIKISESLKKQTIDPKPQLIPVEQLYTTSRAQLSYINLDSEHIQIDNSALAPVTSLIEEEPRTRINRKGICLWMKNDPETTQLLAFHKSAKVGSTINVNYPLTNRSVDVVVIDNIKPNLYPDDVEIIVTKAVALQLGARDSRIQINMDYYQ